MNLLSLLRDAYFFYTRHLGSILTLCLPWILLESAARQMLEHWSTPQSLPIQDLTAALLFYPIYTAALILFMHARSTHQQRTLGALLAQAIRGWLPLAVLVGLSSSLITLGGLLYILPGLWLMVKIALSEYLLVLRGLTPIEALRDSFFLTRQRFWLIAGCLLTTFIPTLLAEYALHDWLPASSNSVSLTLSVDGLLGVIQLFSSVVLFRLYMQIVPLLAE